MFPDEIERLDRLVAAVSRRRGRMLSRSELMKDLLEREYNKVVLNGKRPTARSGKRNGKR